MGGDRSGGAGANYGWPRYEGPESNPTFRNPIFAYRHGTTKATGCAITGGAFYNPTTRRFPSGYVGDYFFADLCSGWSGEPSELYLQLESRHKPNRVNEFGKMVRAAVKRQARLTFDDRHKRVIKPDGSASTRRVMELKLIETS